MACHPHPHPAFFLAGIAFLIAGAASLPAQRPDSPIVTLSASDHSFVAPDTLTAGFTRFQMKDSGPTDHQFVLFQLADTVSLNEFYEAMRKGAASPPGIRSLGGAQGEEIVSLMLAPGRYAFGCMHGFGDGTNHLGRGMFRALTVIPRRQAVRQPSFDATITMHDYGYAMSGKLSAGTRTLRLVNKGPQEHHIMMQRLLPGRTLDDVAKWQDAGRKGPRPVQPVFWGTTRQSAGAILYAVVKLEKGGYILLCRVPDSKDGKPHVEHGMRGVIHVD